MLCHLNAKQNFFQNSFYSLCTNRDLFICTSVVNYRGKNLLLFQNANFNICVLPFRGVSVSPAPIGGRWSGNPREGATLRDSPLHARTWRKYRELAADDAAPLQPIRSLRGLVPTNQITQKISYNLRPIRSLKGLVTTNHISQWNLQPIRSLNGLVTIDQISQWISYNQSNQSKD